MAWTETTRPKYQREGLRYASDTADAEWAVIEPHLPAPASCGRSRETKLRDVVDAIFYIAQSGCQWRLLPRISRRIQRFSGIFTLGGPADFGRLLIMCF